MTQKNSQNAERSSRYVETAVGWYARTREQADLGPYPTKPEAIAALHEYLELFSGRSATRKITETAKDHRVESCTKQVCAICLKDWAMSVIPPTAA